MRVAQLVAHTSPLAAPGGRETGGLNVYVRELSGELARLGIDVDIVTRRDTEAPEVQELADHLRLVRLPAGPACPAGKEEVVGHLPALAEAFTSFARTEREPYALVHSHYWQAGWAGNIAAKALGIPHVTMFHTLGEVKNRARITEHEPRQRIHHERNVARRADAITTASSHERQLLTRYYDADPARLHTIPCGVDLDRFQPGDQAAARAELGLDDGHVILWVGRLEKLKGVDILIEAAALHHGPDFTLVLVGGDAQAEDLKADLAAQARAAGIDGNVRFEGAVPHERLPLYYQAADVLVIPSYYESFGLVAVEAMACGTPVVASRVGGLVSTVTDGVNGYLIPWRCPEPFAERLDVLLHNPELRANFGREARRSVERLAWPRIAGEMAELYEEIARTTTAG